MDPNFLNFNGFWNLPGEEFIYHFDQVFPNKSSGPSKSCDQVVGQVMGQVKVVEDRF